MSRLAVIIPGQQGIFANLDNVLFVGMGKPTNDKDGSRVAAARRHDRFDGGPWIS